MKDFRMDELKVFVVFVEKNKGMSIVIMENNR